MEMGKILSSLLLFLLTGITPSWAQVTFPAGTNLCDTIPWKLVWFDEFEGTAINKDKWFTFLDDNNWDAKGVVVPPASRESRTMNRGVNFMDANVTVSGGTCKLTAKYQPNTWMGSFKRYTSGLIKAKESGVNKPMYFNQGKFEIGARITKAKRTWAAYWLWQGGGHPGGDSEIDIFEYMPTGNANENTYSLHGWNRPGTSKETTVTGTFTYNNIDAWHTYTCEWDSNFVRIYMDDQLRFEGSRYTLANTPGASSGCKPVPGAVYSADVYKAFPFADEYMSLICSMDYRSNVRSRMPDGVFEIDYVRVYQRVPQQRLKDLCSSVTGPGRMRPGTQATFYASIGEGSFQDWALSPGLRVVAKGTANGQPYITVKSTVAGKAWITAIVQGKPRGCPNAELQVVIGAF
jgi:hypothetical protein